MRKIIAAINMTIDGYCDHTAGIPDAEIHQHYTDLLKTSDTILYGRVTYQLMEFWRPFIEKPSGEQFMDDFASAIDGIHKIVFSRTLKSVSWPSASLAAKSLEQVVGELKEQNGTDAFVGSPGLISALTEMKLIDEYQLCVHPVIVGTGLPLFKNIKNKIQLNLDATKVFNCGAVIHYYRRTGS
ncbi:MAG: dihydrofolate reductase family protein [Bacteroidia bacterium]